MKEIKIWPKQYDLIVAGGEAIGLYLALNFLKKGYKVLIIEQKREVGKKVCSGLLSQHIYDFFPDQAQNFISKNYDGAIMQVGSKKYLFHGQACLIDREKMDKYLIDEIRHYGGEILFGQRVLRVKEKNDRVEVETGEYRFHSLLLAGAGGVHSRVRKEIGLPSPPLLLGCRAFSPLDRKNEMVNLYFNQDFSGFFLWKIPRTENLEWGLALDPKQNPREKLKLFLKNNKIKYFNLQSAFLPSYPLKKFVTNRVFLIGDAAGQIKPYTGGGLAYGFTAADIAARVIDPKNPNLLLYQNEWWKNFNNDIRLGRFLRTCYYFPSPLKKLGLAILTRIPHIDQDHPGRIIFPAMFKDKNREMFQQEKEVGEDSETHPVTT